MRINYQGILREYGQRGTAVAEQNLRECLRSGDLRAEEFELGALFVECFGWPAYTACRNGASALETMLEAGTAVTAAQFSNITGQVVFSKIIEGFMSEQFVFGRLVDTVPTRFQQGEKIPSIGAIGDEVEIVSEGGAYPKVGLNEDFVQTPPLVKRGLICPVTREALFFDRTNLVLRRAAEVGEFLGLNKEKRVIDCVVDENVTAHRYNRRNEGAVATYGNNSGSHDWDNLQATNALVDWTDVENAELLLAAITDPNTGEPVMVAADTLIVTTQLLHSARRIVNATEIRFGDGASGTTQTVSRNPLSPYNVVSSRLLGSRMATDTDWFLGNPRKAFAYMEAWPVTVSQAPANSDAEFTQDIVLQFKATEMGAMATLEPRYMIKSTA